MQVVNQTQQQRITGILARFVTQSAANSIFRGGVKNAETRANGDLVLPGNFMDVVSRGLELFCPDAGLRRKCVQEIQTLLRPTASIEAMVPVTIAINVEDDIVQARLSARVFAQKIGFHDTDQSKITTAVSELARNIHRYARTGTILLAAVSLPRTGMRIVARDHGPGIPNLQLILAGQYASKTGMGLGIIGCKRLMDEFAAETAPGRGTCITMVKYAGRAV